MIKLFIVLPFYKSLSAGVGIREIEGHWGADESVVVPRRVREAVNRVPCECVLRVGGTYIGKARSLCTKIALERGATHILYWDSDVVITPENVRRLVAHDLPIVAAAYRYKDTELRNFFVAGMWKDFKRVSQLPAVPNELQRVDWCGAGALLVKREVLEKMTAPWFYHFVNDGEEVGEDFAFCRDAQKAGYGIIVDTDCEVEHINVNREAQMAQEQVDFSVIENRLYRKIAELQTEVNSVLSICRANIERRQQVEAQLADQTKPKVD